MGRVVESKRRRSAIERPVWTSVIINTLRAVAAWETDPGDYPNSLASCALPRRRIVEEIAGELVFRVTPPRAGSQRDEQILYDWAYELLDEEGPRGITVWGMDIAPVDPIEARYFRREKWGWLVGSVMGLLGRCELWRVYVTEFEVDDDYWRDD
jgi:hypothetical protein